MFALVVHEENRPAWRKAFALREVKIGSSSSNDLVLDDTKRVSSYHARVVRKDGKYILVDQKSAHGTFINGRKMTAPQVVHERDTIVIAAMRLEIVTLAYEELAGEAVVARDATEAELLDQIAHGDDGSRAVYADWLEGHGDHDRAELLRLQQLEGDDNARHARLRQLGAGIELPWRARVSQLPIENCVSFSFKCPRQWASLTPTEVEGERFCGHCERTVYYCATIDEARARAAHRECVALDLASPRWDGDLAPPFGDSVCTACELDVGAGLRDCPRCGARIEVEMMMVGEIA